MYQTLESPVQIGEVLASKYRVDRVLGVGGMGVVVAATHLQLDEVVALKFIRREALGDPEIVNRFVREARAAVRLKSEHVARIRDVGTLESGSPYIVMEYLEGQDLASLLKQYGTVATPYAADFIIQACDAIAEAHSLGIIHRDLKPANLFLARTAHGQQTVKVLDFGISKSQQTVDFNMTKTTAIMGSPGYMSPEQMRSAKNVDGRSDIWSLGVILYELVAGRVPFQAETFTELCLKIAMDPLPPLPTPPAVLPPGFEAVINRTLEKDPALRYQSVIDLASALAPFANAQSRDRAYRLVGSTTGAGSDLRTPTGTGTGSDLAANTAPRRLPTADSLVQSMGTAPTENTLDAATGQAGSHSSIQHAPRKSSRKIVFASMALAAVTGIAVAIAVTRGTPGGSGDNSVAGQPATPGATPGPAPTHQAAQPAPEVVTPPPVVTKPPETKPVVDTTPQVPPQTSTTPPPVVTGASSAPAATPDAGVAKPVDHGKDKDKKPPHQPSTTTPAVDPFSSPD